MPPEVDEGRPPEWVPRAGPGVESSARVAGGRVDVAARLEPLEEAAQLGQVLDLDDSADHRRLVVIDLHVRTAQVDLRLGDHRGDVTEQPGAISSLDLDADWKHLARARLPLDVDDALQVAG